MVKKNAGLSLREVAPVVFGQATECIRDANSDSGDRHAPGCDERTCPIEILSSGYWEQKRLDLILARGTARGENRLYL